MLRVYCFLVKRKRFFGQPNTKKYDTLHGYSITTELYSREDSTQKNIIHNVCL